MGNSGVESNSKSPRGGPPGGAPGGGPGTRARQQMQCGHQLAHAKGAPPAAPSNHGGHNTCQCPQQRRRRVHIGQTRTTTDTVTDSMWQTARTQGTRSRNQRHNHKGASTVAGEAKSPRGGPPGAAPGGGPVRVPVSKNAEYRPDIQLTQT